MSQKRRTLSVELKMDILRRLEAGERIMRVSTAMKLPRTTIQTVYKNKEKIKEQLECTAPSSVNRITRKRNSLLERMEKLLTKWVEDNTRQQIPLNRKIIREKAQSIFETLNSGAGGKPLDEISFKASRGWFEKFKRRNNLNNENNLNDETIGEEQLEQTFSNMFQLAIEHGNYAPSQIFNIIQAKLNWKSKEFLYSIEEGSLNEKDSEEWLTVLLVANAVGDFRSKPLLISKSKTLKKPKKEALPIILESNKKPWIKQSTFKNWYRVKFLQEVEKYLLDQNLSNKALIVLDFDPTDLVDSTTNLRINYLQKCNINSNQLRDQEIIAYFRADFLRKTAQKNVSDIHDTIEIINDAWKNVNISVFNNIFQYCATKMKSLQNLETGANILDEESATELEAFSGNNINGKLKINIQQQARHCRKRMQDDPLNVLSSPKAFLEDVGEALSCFEEGLEILERCDRNEERIRKLNTDINKAISCYKELLNDNGIDQESNFYDKSVS